MAQDADPDGAAAPSASEPASEAAPTPRDASELPEGEEFGDFLGRPDVRAQLRQAHYRYAGPLPDPSHLEHYDTILPGAAERIFASWETQSCHRQRLEIRSQWFAFATILAAMATGVACAAFGQPWVGGAIAVTAVGGVSATSILRLFPGSR